MYSSAARSAVMSPDPSSRSTLQDSSVHRGAIPAIRSNCTCWPCLSPWSSWYQDDQGDKHGQQVQFDRIAGMAPRCTLLSCKVLRDDGSGDITALLAALEYIQDLNHGGQEVAVHGINLSVGYPFDPSWFGTGLTPVCREVDRLVNSGVVVVIAAGNTGYGYALDNGGLQMRLGFEMSINDPGNTERAITVGSTSTQPHLTAAPYFP